MTRPMPSTAAEFFSALHKAYDDLIARCVPRYDEMLDRLIQQAPETSGRILELGCGTGNLTVRLAKRFPEAEITVVDASEEMAAATSARSDGRVRSIVARFEDLDLDSGSFDLIVTSISLHHVQTKTEVLAETCRWLSPGGQLWIADQFAGATPEIHQRNWDEWLAFCRRPGGCSEEEIRDLLDHATAHDHYESVGAHFRMLAAGGFKSESIDCVWRNIIWGIIGARKQ